MVDLRGRLAVAGPQKEEMMGLFIRIRQLRSLPGFTLVWRGAPASIKGYRAMHWLQRQPNSLGYQLSNNEYMDYRNPNRPNEGMPSARKSFSSAIAVLAKLASHMPKEVIVFTTGTATAKS